MDEPKRKELEDALKERETAIMSCAYTWQP
jgi:hypothetical protein